MMGSSLVSMVFAAAIVAQTGSGAIREQEISYQKQAFQQWWGTELVMKLDELPKQGKVAEFRVPYSGHDYPDYNGGTVRALAKYDQAFHRGRMLAADFEHRDVSEHRNHRGNTPETMYVRGPFGRVRAVRTRRAGPPTWYGHCNGWTAAAIRHAEPQRNVVRNGVVFTPADIKGMLAEIYMYSDTEFLGGVDAAINPATLHLTLTNWLGRGSLPIGMEAAMGEVVINYPVHEYTSTINRYAPNAAEVQTMIVYAMNTPRETDQSPRIGRKMYFHYALDLDSEGNITGGRYYNDSQRVDMLWSPLKPVQGGEKGNERGNPHLDVKEVLAIWRESVPEEIRKQWLNIDPTTEDRIVLPGSEEPSEPAAETTAANGAAPATEGGSATTEGAAPSATPPAAETPAPATGNSEAAEGGTPSPAAAPEGDLTNTETPEGPVTSTTEPNVPATPATTNE